MPGAGETEEQAHLRFTWDSPTEISVGIYLFLKILNFRENGSQLLWHARTLSKAEVPLACHAHYSRSIVQLREISFWWPFVNKLDVSKIDNI